MLDGNEDGEKGIGNAVSSNVMAGWRARGEKEQLGGSFYKLYKCTIYLKLKEKFKKRVQSGISILEHGLAFSYSVKIYLPYNSAIQVNEKMFT